MIRLLPFGTLRARRKTTMKNKDDTPNILLVLADQLTAFALFAYGNCVCRAPNIRALAERGTVFENAYCNYPLCAPARCALMSGRLPSRVGAYDNAAEFAASQPTIAHYLREAGYYCCLSGKMHFVGPDQLHGFEDRLTTEIYPSDFGWTPAASYGEDQSVHAGGLAAGVSSAETIAESGPLARTMQMDYDEETARRACQRLYDWARYGDGRPFFLTVSFTQPHDPYVVPKKYWDLHGDDEIDPPRVAPIPPEQLDPHSRELHRHYNLHRVAISEKTAHRARRGYYGMVAYIDEKFGELTQTLADVGADDNTVVIFSSDHGDMLGERGMWFKKTLFDPAVRVPLIAHWPGRKSNPHVRAPVSLVDLLPTLAEVATGDTSGIVPPMDGSSLLPLMFGEDESERTVFAEHLDGATDAPRVMARKGALKYVFSEAYPPQLFDLSADPGETENLAGIPHWAEKENEMHAIVGGTWDFAALKEEIVRSQKTRRLLHSALSKGRAEPWEPSPNPDCHTRFVRAGDLFPECERRGYLPYSD